MHELGADAVLLRGLTGGDQRRDLHVRDVDVHMLHPEALQVPAFQRGVVAISEASN